MAKLAAAITSSQTLIELFGYINQAEIPARGVVLIDSERIKYTNTTDREIVGCTRGYEGTTAATHANGAVVTLLTEANVGEPDNNPAEVAEYYDASGSHQTFAGDLHVSSTVGSSSSPKHIGAIMGNIFGNAVSTTKPELFGVLGAFSITGTNATTYPSGAVLGEISDGVVDVDGAFVAFIDGDSAQTNARAAYAVRNNNSVPGSGFAFGLDLKGDAHDGYPAVSYTTGEIRFSNGTKVTVSGNTVVFTNAAGTKSFTITMV